jgi:hypothetical protein
MPAVNLKADQWELIRDALLFQAKEHEKASRRHIGKPARGMLLESKKGLEELAALIEAGVDLPSADYAETENH